MGKKLLEKAGLIGDLRAVQGEVLNGSTPEPAKPRTAPGTMMGFMAAQSGAIHENEKLRDQLRQFDGSQPVRALDPATIVASKWANRHALSFSSASFEALKAEIAHAGGNVQPIKVRPLPGAAAGAAAYELIYGHRRHRACLELGLPVKAFIEDADDTRLFEEMERENRHREDLSAWEQGTTYRRALDEGLYPSLRKLAEAVDVDVSLVSKSVALARLPDEVIAAFTNPLEIQYRWAQPLTEAQQKDPEGMLARARELVALEPRPGAADVLHQLIGGGVLNGSTREPMRELPVGRGKQRLAVITTDAKGRAVVRFEPGALPDGKRKELASLIEGLLLK